MEIIVDFAKDGETVEGFDDDGLPISDLGRPGLDRAIGLVHERRQKRFAKLAKMADDLAERIRDGSLQLDTGKYLRASLNKKGFTSYAVHDADGKLEVGPLDEIEDLMAALPQSRTTFG